MPARTFLYTNLTSARRRPGPPPQEARWVGASPVLSVCPLALIYHFQRAASWICAAARVIRELVIRSPGGSKLHVLMRIIIWECAVEGAARRDLIRSDTLNSPRLLRPVTRTPDPSLLHLEQCEERISLISHLPLPWTYILDSAVLYWIYYINIRPFISFLRQPSSCTISGCNSSSAAGLAG